MTVEKGDVYFADLNPVVGSEQGGIRPVVVIQNNIGNLYSPTVVAAITSRMNKNPLPTHVVVKSNEGGLFDDSIVMLEQIRTIDKSRLKNKIGQLDQQTMKKVEDAMLVSFGIQT